ncbi:TPA: hypothetical protein OOF36_000329 [Morganella morganii]|nr:hypothetical protein [Vibrio vulnificus]HCR4016127.1 hypothetical protein [Morganella morganii]
MGFKESMATFYPISNKANIDDYADMGQLPPPCIVYNVDRFPSSVEVKCVIGLHVYLREGSEYHITINAYDTNGDMVSKKVGDLISDHNFFDIIFGDGTVSYFLNSRLNSIEFKESGVYELRATMYSGLAGDANRVELSKLSSYLYVTTGALNAR